MASVHLNFVPPDDENIVTLEIYESTVKEGPFSIIESVTSIGTYPGYIDEYTTSVATSISDWFAIRWIDNKGAASQLSIPVKGDATTPVGEIASRVKERSPTISDRIIVQEAEAAISYVFPTIDPYDSTVTFSYVEKRGLTNMTLAMCYLAEMAQTSSSNWTAGILSMKTSDAAVANREKAIEKLMKQVNVDLNLNFSYIGQLTELAIAGLPVTINELDQSRLLVELR